MYSPTIPTNASCTDDMKKNPIRIGARPKLNSVPEEQLGDEIPQREQEAQRRHPEPQHRRQPERDLRVIDDAEHGKVVQGIEVVARDPPLPERLAIRHRRRLIAQLPHQPAKVRVGIVELPELLDHHPVVQPEPGRLPHDLDVRNPSQETVIGPPQPST